MEKIGLTFMELIVEFNQGKFAALVGSKYETIITILYF